MQRLSREAQNITSGPPSIFHPSFPIGKPVECYTITHHYTDTGLGHHGSYEMTL